MYLLISYHVRQNGKFVVVTPAALFYILFIMYVRGIGESAMQSKIIKTMLISVWLIFIVLCFI